MLKVCVLNPPLQIVGLYRTIHITLSSLMRHTMHSKLCSIFNANCKDKLTTLLMVQHFSCTGRLVLLLTRYVAMDW